jgi:hypothetical protein
VGTLSCAHRLSWKVGLSPGAARERVRVAARLRELPAVAESFGRGEMSWTQARAITRVARPDDGIDWVEIARSTSGAKIEKVVRGMRRAQAVEEAKQDCERAAWLVRTRKTDDANGNLVLTIYANAEVAPVVEAAFEAAFEAKRAELEREAEEEAARARDVPAGTPRVTDGDALLAIAQDALCHAKPTADLARRNRYRLTADGGPLSGRGRIRDGELLPPSSLTTALKSLPGRGGAVRLRPGLNVSVLAVD